METNLQKVYEKRMKVFSDIIKSAYNSYNWFHENVDELTYEVGLKCELEQAGYIVRRQECYPVYYKGVKTDILRRIDVVVQSPYLGDIILELKAIDRVDDSNRRQLWSYLRQLNHTYGMLINFSPKGVYYEIWEYNVQTNKCIRVTI